MTIAELIEKLARYPSDATVWVPDVTQDYGDPVTWVEPDPWIDEDKDEVLL